jgi:molecular chaperone GrpE (heat shock protein)
MEECAAVCSNCQKTTGKIYDPYICANCKIKQLEEKLKERQEQNKLLLEEKEKYKKLWREEHEKAMEYLKYKNAFKVLLKEIGVK